MSVLVWAIKGSLVGYVRGMADGEIALDGAAEDASGFRFREAPESEPAVRRFTGRVRFTGHNGMMRVVIADPWVEASGPGAVLSIADPDDPAARLPFARIAAFDGVRASGTTLTADGADLFFGPYREGTELDDPRLQG
ncbi:HtaA domain-containing protein [Microbacterium mangrovi]|nr:HtaA domain-containing protein [Microbacterium mangrovi]